MAESIAWSAVELANAYRNATGTPGGGNRIICPVHGDEGSEDNCTLFELESSGAIWATCHSQDCDPQDILALVYESLGMEEEGTAPPEANGGIDDVELERWAPNTRVDDWPNFDKRSEVFWLPRKPGTRGVTEIRFPVRDGVCGRKNCKRAHTLETTKCITSSGRANNSIVNMWAQQVPPKGSVVYWCEGPKDAVKLARMGYPAVAGPGGEKHGGSCDYSVLKDWKVVICADNDNPGVRCAVSAELALLEAGVEVLGFTKLVGKAKESPADLPFADMVEILSHWLGRNKWLEESNLPILIDNAGNQVLLSALDELGWRFRYDIMQDEKWVDYGDGEWHTVGRQTVADVNRRIAQRLHKPTSEGSDPIQLSVNATREMLELGCLRPENGVVVAWDEFLAPIINGERTMEIRLSDVLEHVYQIQLTELEKAGINLLLPHLVWRVWRLWDMAKNGDVQAGGDNWQQRIVPILYDKRGGIGKSTLINSLLVNSGKWVETMTLDEVDAKTYVEKTKSALLVNFDDFENLRGREFGRLKQFVTNEKETVRLAYRWDAETFPRVGMLVASTNKKRVLADEENTRFLYVDLDGAREGVTGGDVREYLNEPGVREGLLQTAWEDCREAAWRPYLSPRLTEALRNASKEHQWIQDSVENSGIQSLIDQLHMAEEDGDTECITEPYGVVVQIWTPQRPGYGKHVTQKNLIDGLPYVVMAEFAAALTGKDNYSGRGASQVLDMLDRIEQPYSQADKVFFEVRPGRRRWRRFRIMYL